MSMHDDQVAVIEYGFAALAFCLSAIWLRVKHITSADEISVNVVSEPEINGNPYRTVAPKPQEYIEEQPKQIELPKPKKEYHMNKNLKKILKISVCVTGLSMCSVLIGAINDASLGTGLKLGIQLGLVPFGMAFFIAAIVIAIDEF